MIIYPFLIFIASMILLLKGADLFVEEAARIARLLGISGFIIGLTLVSIGTSLPELATNITAAIYGQTSIVVGNIIGSNIANVGFVLGIAAVLTTIVLKREKYQKDALFLLGISVLFYILALDGTISATEGLAFLAIFIVYLYRLFKRTPAPEEHVRVRSFLKAYVHPNGKINLKNYEACIAKGLNYRLCTQLMKQGIDIKGNFKKKILNDVYKKLFFIVISILALYLGSKYLVISALSLATAFAISPGVIAVTAIALGTSLPELFVTITSARKGMSSILLGNLIGSGVTNLLLVGGIAALITPLVITSLDLYFYIPYMLFMILIFIQFIHSRWLSKVLQGILLLFFYSIFIFFTVIFQGL